MARAPSPSWSPSCSSSSTPCAPAPRQSHLRHSTRSSATRQSPSPSLRPSATPAADTIAHSPAHATTEPATLSPCDATIADIMTLVSNGTLHPGDSLADAIALLPPSLLPPAIPHYHGRSSRPAPYDHVEREERERQRLKARHQPYTAAKEGITYRLAAGYKPWATTEGWEKELTRRKDAWAERKASAGSVGGSKDFITVDAQQPPAPRLPTRISTLEGPGSTWKLPFARNFRTAPIIGAESPSDDGTLRNEAEHRRPSNDAPRDTGPHGPQISHGPAPPRPHSPHPPHPHPHPRPRPRALEGFANLTVTTADGKQTILQRFSPTSERKAKKLESMAEEGARLKEVLFDAASAQQRCNAELLVLGSWYNMARQFGWTADHLNCPKEADDMLRWTWRFFHDHILPVRNLLAKDLRLELDQRLSGFKWAQEMVGEDQLKLAHHYWTMCGVLRGFSTEHHDPKDAEGSFLASFGQACVLCIATDQGFFKTVIHPGQFVVFRTSFPHSVQPLAGASGGGESRWAISLALRRHIDKMVYGQKIDIKARENPPQLEEEDVHRLRHPATARRARASGEGTRA